MKHKTWIQFSGIVWFAIGFLLFYKGMGFIRGAELSQSVTLMLTTGALLVGFFKARFVLSKSVRRVVSRIASLPLPIRLTNAYAPSYWILIAAMMGIGMSFKYLPISLALRGFIDIAIGFALIQGGLMYFKAATYDRSSPSQSQ